MSRFKTFSKLLMWEVVNPAILRSRRGRLYDWDEAFNGLNLACGLDVLPNWMGIDGGVCVLFKKLPSIILRWVFPLLNMSEVYTYQEYSSKLSSINVLHYDLGYGVPFRSNTVPNIYSSHFLEHLTRQGAERLLRECFRVLRPGGGIRIAVPSLDQEVAGLRLAIAQYDRGQIEPVLKYLTTRPGFINQYSVHRYMYNFNEMKTLLESGGFVDVVEEAYRTGRIVDIEKLDTRQDSLFVEATKGKV